MTAEPCTLELEPDQMRALGYQVIDRVVDHLTTLRDRPAGRITARGELETRLREALPETGEDPAAVLSRVVDEVFGSMLHVQHPRFFGFVPSPSNYLAVLADALTAGFNPFVGTWFVGSGPARLELVTIDWLRRLCGLPEEELQVTIDRLRSRAQALAA